MKTNALLIFTRNPEIGKVKTRLAKTIGDQNALTVYHDLLNHTKNVTEHADCDKFVFYDSHVSKNDLWPESIYQKKLQIEGDLGQRMQTAFDSLFEMGYERCIIVGSDLFDLTKSIIEKAFKQLKTYDVAIGPAEDGGYYLLGLKKKNDTVFVNKKWGTDSVYEATIKDLKHFKIAILPTLNDIDTFEDLERSGYDCKNIKINTNAEISSKEV